MTTFTLDDIEFGSISAQQETHLSDYFYRSGAFIQAGDRNTYLVLGAKGAGKSAIYKMLFELKKEIKSFALPHIGIADEPQLRDLWEILISNNLTKSKVNLWKFYFASLLADCLIKDPNFDKIHKKQYQKFLARWGLVQEFPTTWQALRDIKIEVGVNWGVDIKTEFPPKTPLTTNEIDAVINTANAWLRGQGAIVWICLDSLDEVSTNGYSQSHLEELLSDLMRASSEILRLSNIRFKLFFRTDIYNALTYVNKDHFSASKLELKWEKEDLAIMLAHRLVSLHPEHFKNKGISYALALDWINQLFDWKSSQLAGFDDLCIKCMDGNGNVLPRNILLFCIEAKNIQIQFNIQEINLCQGQYLFSGAAINKALQNLATSQLNDFLQIFQNFGRTYSLLRGHHTEKFSRAELSKALNINDHLQAQSNIADLVRVGAIAVKDKKAVNQSDAFEIPFLYALALDIGQGEQ